MNTIKLNNNVEIPQIGVGTWTLRGETARRNVRQALEAGFRHIDTAQGYDVYHRIKVCLYIEDACSRGKVVE